MGVQQAPESWNIDGRQSYGALVGPLNTRCRIVSKTQKGTMILTTTPLDLGWCSLFSFGLGSLAWIPTVCTIRAIWALVGSFEPLSYFCGAHVLFFKAVFGVALDEGAFLKSLFYRREVVGLAGLGPLTPKARVFVVSYYDCEALHRNEKEPTK